MCGRINFHWVDSVICNFQAICTICNSSLSFRVIMWAPVSIRAFAEQIAVLLLLYKARFPDSERHMQLFPCMSLKSDKDPLMWNSGFSWIRMNLQDCSLGEIAWGFCQSTVFLFGVYILSPGGFLVSFLEFWQHSKAKCELPKTPSCFWGHLPCQHVLRKGELSGSRGPWEMTACLNEN